MWTNLTPIGEPDFDILTLTQAKAHLRVFHNEDDTYIRELVAAARDYISGPRSTGYALCLQSWRLAMDEFPPVIEIGLRPVQSITRITYRDHNDEVQELDPSAYWFDGDQRPAVIKLKGDAPRTSKAPGALKIEFVAGYADQAEIPADFIHAARVLVAHWMLHREATGEVTSELPFSVGAVLAKYQVTTFG